MKEVFLETVSLNILVQDVINFLYKSNINWNDGKICQNIKPPTPTHIPFSVRLSICGGGGEEIRRLSYIWGED